MTYHLRPARRGEAKPLLGLYSESGCGKTLSALYLARGFVGPTGRIGMIETESGRGEAYAETLPGGYDVISMRENFSPQNFGDAISAAEKAELQALIIDSASLEWEGVGGVLDMASKNQQAGMKGVQVWQKPKIDHLKHFVLRLLGTPIPLVIVCMRAKYPMEEKLVSGEKKWVRSETLDPIQAENILFELFAHGWIDRTHNFHGTKWTLDSLKAVLRDGEPISIATGQRLAEWARGASTEPAAAPSNLEEADAVIGRIRAGFAKLEMPAQAQEDAWREHCGAGAFLSPQTDVSALNTLLNALRARARRTA